METKRSKRGKERKRQKENGVVQRLIEVKIKKKVRDREGMKREIREKEREEWAVSRFHSPLSHVSPSRTHLTSFTPVKSEWVVL